MKKILFNCSTNIQGGAAQNAANFIISSQDDHNNGLIEYHYIVSEPVKSILDGYRISPENLFFIQKSPARNFNSRKEVLSIEKRVAPNLVYTMAGPSYVNFKSIHVMGSSNPYVIFARKKDISFGRSGYKFLIRYLNTYYQKLHASRADFFIFQTKSSAESFSGKFNISPNNYFYVPNSLGANKENNEIGRSKKDTNETLEILCPFENYPHKGFHLLPKISSLLLEKKLKHKFIVTIKKDEHSSAILGNQYLEDNIKLIGKRPYQAMGELYAKTDIVFMPSILEIFSSVCLEALFFKKPLVLADRSFNRDIVNDFAFYCDPYSIKSCIKAIESASTMVNDEVYLQEAKEFIISNYGSYNDRYTSIRDILIKLLP